MRLSRDQESRVPAEAGECGRSVHVERTDRFAERDPADRLGEQLGDAALSANYRQTVAAISKYNAAGHDAARPHAGFS